MPKLSHWTLGLALVTVLDSSLDFGAERMRADWLWLSAVFIGARCLMAVWRCGSPVRNKLASTCRTILTRP